MMNNHEGNSSNSSPMLFNIDDKMFENASDLKSPQIDLQSPSIDSLNIESGTKIIPGLKTLKKKFQFFLSLSPTLPFQPLSPK